MPPKNGFAATSTSKAALKLEAMEQMRVRCLRQLSEMIQRHRPDLIAKGARFSNRPHVTRYLPAESQIQVSFHIKDEEPITVSIAVERIAADNLRFHPTCSCIKSVAQFLCEHTYAAFQILFREFHISDSELVKEVLGSNEPSWQKVFRAIDDFVRQQSTVVESDRPAFQSRLAWRLNGSKFKTFTLEPVEQTPSKRGGWNKGRAIGWDRVSMLEDVEFLPADHEVLRMIGDSRYRYFGPTNDQVGRLVEKLIGHPYVFFDTDPVEVVRGQLGLMLKESEKNWNLVPAVNGVEFDEFDYISPCDNECGIAVDLEQSKVMVVRASYELWEMSLELLTDESPIPPEVQEEFLKRLPVLEAKVPIELPSSLKGEFVPAEQHQILRLIPNETAGASVQIQVQPAPQGSCFSPGEGPQEVTGQVEQNRVQVKRDLIAEIAGARKLADELFLNRFRNLGSYHWQITSDDEVLDLLDVLRARPEKDPVVLWPADHHPRKMVVLGEISPSALRVEIKDQHDWFGLSGSVTLGGVQFPLASLLTALKSGRRYIDLGKGQFAAISQEFRERLSSVSDMIHSNRGKLEFNATAAPLMADLFDQEVTLKASKKWRESLKRLQRASELDPVVPSTLQAELRDYQVDGYKWLRRLAEWGVGGCLADDMGLGKTVQTIAVLLDRREVGPTLIVAPVSVGFNWMREIERFAPTLRPILYRDTDRVEFLTSLTGGDLLITSYHLLQQHIAELSTIKWGTLILDEAQAIKNSQTKTAQAVRQIEAEWRLALTGTPAENHLGDLWSVFRGVSPGLFGSWERFREVFADPIEKGKDVSRKQALSRVVRPYILRRNKSEVLTELPSRTEIQLTAELSPAERRVYEDARLWAVSNLTNLVAEQEKDQRFQVLAALTKLRQLACHPRLVDQAWDRSSAKLDLFLETLTELREGRHRALVFSQFTQHLALVREALDEREIAYQYLDGSTPASKRQDAVEAFQRGEGELFLISLKAGGTGLNLTAADYVVHLDPWWNPAVEDQATDRAHRIGQTRPVTVYRLVAKDTIEEQILKLHADKRGLIAGILEGTDAAAKLSTAELIDLIKLGGKN